MAVLTILDAYEKQKVDLLYSEAVDLLSLLDDKQFETFYEQNPRFVDLTSGDFRNTEDLGEIINMLVDYITQ